MAEFLAIEGRGLLLDIEARDEIYEKDAYNSAKTVCLPSCRQVVKGTASMNYFLAAVLASKTAVRLSGRLAVLRAFFYVLGIVASSRLIGCARTTLRRISRSASPSVN